MSEWELEMDRSAPPPAAAASAVVSASAALTASGSYKNDDGKRSGWQKRAVRSANKRSSKQPASAASRSVPAPQRQAALDEPPSHAGQSAPIATGGRRGRRAGNGRLRSQEDANQQGGGRASTRSGGADSAGFLLSSSRPTAPLNSWRHATAEKADFNKERYLQACCQFIVRDGYYGTDLSDVDRLVDWDCIEEVRLRVDAAPDCPICLFPPVAAQITRCGHVYCWPCVLHYLALSDRSWRKCPICDDAVHRVALRSAVVVEAAPPTVGATMELSLMRRDRHSVVASPLRLWPTGAPQLLHPGDAADSFSKLLVASAAEVQRLVVERERRELNARLDRDADEPEACFVHEALELLAAREAALVGSGPRPRDLLSPSDPFAPDKVRVPVLDMPDVKPQFYIDAFNDVLAETPTCEDVAADEVTGQAAAMCLSDEPPNVQRRASVDSSATSVFYFYQDTDGRHVYLQPLNARCLSVEYGRLEGAPLTVSGRIVDVESLTMTAAFRQRFRYLSHLPLSTHFSLVELDLDAKYLSKSTNAQFAPEFAWRRKRREQLRREESRRDRHAQQWERAVLRNPAMYGRYTASSSRPPPDVPEIRYVASAQADLQAAFNAAIDDDDASPPLGDGGVDAQDGDDEWAAVPSFAEVRRDCRVQLQWLLQKLRTGKPRTVAAVESAPTLSSWTDAATASYDNDDLPAPSFHYSFGAAMQTALDGLAAVNPSPPSGKSKKARKQRPTVLFSMGAPNTFH